MHTYKLIISYDGTQYGGWQIQPNAPTIQAHIEDALKIISRQTIKIAGSGRTDAGVHAMGQTAHFRLEERIDTRRTLHSLNALLPHDIRILNLEAASPDFHAQYSAKGKIYHYHLWLEKVQSPFLWKYRVQIHQKLNWEALKNGIAHFIGTHDFTSFANEAHMGAASYDPVRTLKRLDIVPQEGGLRLEFEADGFLYRMVRNITGTLLEVGCGKRDPEEIPAILAKKDRKLAGTAAPAHGLFLMQVFY